MKRKLKFRNHTKCCIKAYKNYDERVPEVKGVSVIEYDSMVYWYQDGELHRTDGPAVELANGDKEWYLKGKLHRADGPAIKLANGDKLWYSNGELHREDGPAVDLSTGNKEWYLNGKLHRTDGPAVENIGDVKNIEWWLNGEEYSETEYKEEIQKHYQPR